MKKAFPVPVRAQYSCLKCPGYCCSYPEIEVTPRDIERLAKHFGLGYAQAEERLTKYEPKERVRLLRCTGRSQLNRYGHVLCGVGSLPIASAFPVSCAR